MMSMMMGGAKYGVGGTSIMTSPDMTSSLSPDPPSPAHSDSSNSNIPPTSPSGQLRGASKECGVCGDVAKSMHFGGLSCDSCKAFFRRSVQNNAYKGFSCPYEKKCVIGVSSRKACQYCRFEKCLSIGMEKGWVMSEEERRKMMEQRREKKQKQSQENAQRQHDAALYSLSEEDRSEIARIVSLYKKAYNTIPYEEVPSPSEGGNGQSIGGASGGSFVLGPWMTFCKRIAYFFSLFRDFAELSASDQSLLLRTALTSAGIIMGSVVYDSNSGKWAAKLNRSRVNNLPSISSQSVEKLVPSDLINRVDRFFKKFQQICPDETMAMILILVSLYSPELMGLEARDRVQHLQERYIHILQNYVKFKFRERSSVMFPKAIVSLADIRELADRTGQMRIHDKAASMFSSMMHSAGPGLGGLGSPHSGLSLSPVMPASPNGDELIPISGSSGPKNDPIYQRIMKVLYQTHGSSLNTLTPTLLPLIIQILKKWAHARQEGRSGRALTGTSRKAHRHPRPKTHRGSMQRPRRMSVKKESSSHEDLSLTIKEEVMDHSEDTILQMGAEASHVIAPESHFGPSQMPSQDFMEAFPQIQQQHFQTPTFCPPPTPPDLTHTHTSTSPMFQSLPDLIHQQPPDGSFMAPSQSPFPTEGSPLAYPHAMSPEENGFQPLSQQQQQQPAPMAHSPQPLPLSPHLQTTAESPHLPPMSPFPPPAQQVMSPPPLISFQQQDSQSSYASLGPSNSPYSSSSSSSSPEDADTARGDFFHEDLTETEVDVIMQLMERVSSFDLLERGGAGGSVTDILPLPLLKELQNKLCSLNNSSSNPSSPDLFMEDIMTSTESQTHHCLSQGGSGDGGMELQPTLGMGICMEMDSSALGMDPTMVLGAATPMDMVADSMEVDQPTSMNSCT